MVSASISVGGNAPVVKGVIGIGGGGGVIEIECCKSGKLHKQRWAYYEGGVSLGVSAKLGPNVAVTYSSSDVGDCKKPELSFYSIQFHVITVSSSGVSIGASIGLSARLNSFGDYLLVDEFETETCC